MVEVVQFPRINFNDIPARLRALADEIESGKTTAPTVYILVPREDNFPIIMGLGDIEGDNAPIVQLALAKHWFLQNLVARDG